MPLFQLFPPSSPYMMARCLKVYSLAGFTEDETDEIFTQLEDDFHDSYPSYDVRVNLVPWTRDQDGGKDDIFRLFLEDQDLAEDFMFFIDRKSLDLQDFLVADVRAARTDDSAMQGSLSPRDSDFETSLDCASSSGYITPVLHIPLVRCGGYNGWYGSPYSGIKQTYMSLLSGRTTLDEVMHKTRAAQRRVSELTWTSSMLDTCEEEYSAQVLLAHRQADQLCRELQANSASSEDGTAQNANHLCDGRGRFYHRKLPQALQAS